MQPNVKNGMLELPSSMYWINTINAKKEKAPRNNPKNKFNASPSEVLFVIFRASPPREI